MKFILLDLSQKAVLPETLLYTASFLKQKNLAEMQSIYRIDSYDDFEELINNLPFNLEHNSCILFWQQDWIYPGKTFLMLKIARQIKQSFPSVRLVCSGSLPTQCPDLFFNEQLFDIILRGYPWASSEWATMDKAHAPTICISSHPHHLPEDLSLSEGFKFVSNSKKMFGLQSDGNIQSTYYSSFHCDNRCPFCFNSAFYKLGGSIIKSMDTIKEEIPLLKNNYNVNMLKNEDNNIFCSLEHGRDVLNYLAATNDLKLVGNMDVMVRDLTSKNIALLHKAGVNQIFFGIESLNPETRTKLNKEFDDTDLHRAIEYGSKKGIVFVGNVLVGVANSANNPLNLKCLEDEKKLILDMLNKYPNLCLQLRIFMPLLGTPIGDKIWSETSINDNMDLETYLRLIDAIIFNKEFPQKLPLPSCYESIDVIKEAANFSTALNALNQLRKQGFEKLKGRSLYSIYIIYEKLLRTLLKLGFYKILHFNKAFFDSKVIRKLLNRFLVE